MQSKSTSTKSTHHDCKYPAWQLVVNGDESHTGFADAVAHVEGCTVCQVRLESTLSSGISWWGEARKSWLECDLPTTKSDSDFGSVIVEVQSEMPDDSRIELETVTLSFLDSPRHPELLGRLGRYDIERVIGTGGMGVVLKAHDTELHRVVAVKVLAAHLANNASARKRFAREAQAAAAVIHPNVIPIYNVESEGKVPFLVMQCVNGQSLQSKVDRHGPMPLAESLRIAMQTASGLAAAHDQGLVHRDVKPANILLHDNVDRVLLSDFGLARAVDDASLTRTGVVAGTPHYMSPEQARGDSIDTRSDQFSLGSVMYYMLTGRPPFRASGAMGVLNRICTEPHRSIEQVNSDIPIEITQLIDRLLSKDASDRFASMHVVEQELEGLLAALQSGRLSLSRRDIPSTIAWPAGFALRSEWWVSLGLIGIAAIVCAIVFLTTIDRSDDKSKKTSAALNQLLSNSHLEQELNLQIADIQSQLDWLEASPQPFLQKTDANFYLDVQTIHYQLDAINADLLTYENGEQQ
ncbi:MAG: serine/threonine-protein kinase [Pirellula sp.]